MSAGSQGLKPDTNDKKIARLSVRDSGLTLGVR
ncbi:hypothetical protein GGE07_000953 [Sinorhizobium terangae]|nr:hypothetical protein [Sinorhizobium terangae]